MYLCTHFSAGVASFNEVSNVSDCSGYISEQATNFGISALTYSDANQLLGAVAGLFALAFVFRALLHFIMNK
jgi:hypothetical protein